MENPFHFKHLNGFFNVVLTDHVYFGFVIIFLMDITFSVSGMLMEYNYKDLLILADNSCKYHAIFIVKNKYFEVGNGQLCSREHTYHF